MTVPHADVSLAIDPALIDAAADSRFGLYGPGPFLELLSDAKGADRLVRILVPFLFYLPDGRVIWVPQDVICDGASIPRPLWSVFGGPFEGDHRNRALFHDAAYQRVLAGDADAFNTVRGEADQLFQRCCRASGMTAWRAQLRYRGVRLGGRDAWRAHRRAAASPPSPTR
jgi:hypothetical protein